jgi:hypothetical protein
LRRIERRHLRGYYRRLLRSYVNGGGNAFRRKHLASLRELGRAPGPLDLSVAFAEEVAASVARPQELLRQLRAAASHR